LLKYQRDIITEVATQFVTEELQETG